MALFSQGGKKKKSKAEDEADAAAGLSDAASKMAAGKERQSVSWQPPALKHPLKDYQARSKDGSLSLSFTLT